MAANARNVWDYSRRRAARTPILRHFQTNCPGGASWPAPASGASCADCGAPWVRVVDKSFEKSQEINNPRQDGGDKNGRANNFKLNGYGPGMHQVSTLGWQPACDCNANTVPSTVLDPFAGSGTTLAVAQSLGRKSIGLDLNPEYLEIAKRYINRADGITLSLGL